MSEQAMGFYFTCNADKSAHDHTIYVQQRTGDDTITLGARYKNAEPNHLYEIEMDAADLLRFAELCVNLVQSMAEE
jgi:hypothetical protein